MCFVVVEVSDGRSDRKVAREPSGIRTAIRKKTDFRKTIFKAVYIEIIIQVSASMTHVE